MGCGVCGDLFSRNSEMPSNVCFSNDVCIAFGVGEGGGGGGDGGSVRVFGLMGLVNMASFPYAAAIFAGVSLVRLVQRYFWSESELRSQSMTVSNPPSAASWIGYRPVS